MGATLTWPNRAAALTFAALLATGTAHASPPTQYTPAQLLKNFALSTCVARGFADPTLQREARAAAGAYVEFGNHGPEAYAQAGRLADEFLARPYHAKGGKTALVVMKCVDLFHSPELDALAGSDPAKRKGQAEKPGP
jgi:hypothetical protein